MSQPTDRRMDRLIHLLAENATVVMPGPKIASEIGVTRATVWVWIERLRSLGIEIQGYPATGYQHRGDGVSGQRSAARNGCSGGGTECWAWPFWTHLVFRKIDWHLLLHYLASEPLPFGCSDPDVVGRFSRASRHSQDHGACHRHTLAERSAH